MQQIEGLACPQALDLLHDSLVIVHSADVLLECVVPDWAIEAMNNGHGAKRYKVGGYRWFLGGNSPSSLTENLAHTS
jgi:hypothetical protein